MRTARSLLAAALLLSAVLTVSAEKVTTKHKCYYDGSWSDVCWYKDICFRGSPSNLVFITDDPEEVYISPPSLAAKIFATTKMLRQIHGMPRVNRPGPIHYKVHQTEVRPCFPQS